MPCRRRPGAEPAAPGPLEPCPQQRREPVAASSSGGVTGAAPREASRGGARDRVPAAGASAFSSLSIAPPGKAEARFLFAANCSSSDRSPCAARAVGLRPKQRCMLSQRTRPQRAASRQPTLCATTCCEQVQQTQRVITRLAYSIIQLRKSCLTHQPGSPALPTARANIVPSLPINPDPRTLMRIEGSIRQLWLHHDLDRLALVHGPIAAWDLVEPNHPVEYAAGFDPALKHVWE